MKIVGALLENIGASRPYAESNPLRLADISLADPRPGELLVKIDAAGICHSDLSVVNGDRVRQMPMLLGHEAAATVLSAPQSEEFQEGDRVVLAFLAACGHCVQCVSGRGYLCAEGIAANAEGRLLRGGSRLCEGACTVHHHLGVSAFATHAVVDARSAVKIDPDVPPEIAALFGCAVLTGVGAVLNTGALRPGETVAVFGLGGVGLAALLGALAGGASKVLVVDPVEAKRALALELGAAAAFSPEGALAAIQEATGGGVDLSIETVGSAAVLADAYTATGRGGRAVTVSLPHPAQMLSIPALSLVAGAKTLMGSYMGSSIPKRDIPAYIALWRSGRLPVHRLLSSVSPLSEINLLFDRLAAGQAIRQIVTP